MARAVVARQRGMGMTEYVILAGLVALLLFQAVGAYKNQIEITLVGGERGGMTGGMNSAADTLRRTADGEDGEAANGDDGLGGGGGGRQPDGDRNDPVDNAIRGPVIPGGVRR